MTIMEILTLFLSECTCLKRLFCRTCKKCEIKEGGWGGSWRSQLGQEQTELAVGPQTTHLTLLILTASCETTEQLSQEWGGGLRAIS